MIAFTNARAREARVVGELPSTAGGRGCSLEMSIKRPSIEFCKFGRYLHWLPSMTRSSRFPLQQ